MTRIIVGLTGDARDSTIIDWVSKFAGDLSAHVILVHTVPRTTLWIVSSVQADSDKYLAKVRSHFDRDVAEPLRGQGLVVTLRVTRGDAAHELADIAHKTGAELIVIGGPDHTALHDAVSSIARRLEHCSEVPVVVVPKARAVSSGRA